MDCTEQADLCGEYGVTGYPTLKVFRNGVPTDYSGPRKADGIISYMIKWVSADCSLFNPNPQAISPRRVRRHGRQARRVHQGGQGVSDLARTLR